MNDQQFWNVIEQAWTHATELRDQLRRREPIEPAALSGVIFALIDVLATLNAEDATTFIATWRPKAYGLRATERVPDVEVACLVVALGRGVYQEAMHGLWKNAGDPSEGAFAAMLAGFDDDPSPVSPLARPSIPMPSPEPDTPAPSAVRRWEPPTG